MNKFIVTFLVGLLSFTATAVLNPVDQQKFVYQNLLLNPGFENGSASWTASGGTTKTANTTAKGTLSYGYDFDSSAAAQTVSSETITIPAGLQGQNAVAFCGVKTPSGTATHNLEVFDGTNVIASVAVTTSSTRFANAITNFVFPTSGTVLLRIKSVASNEPEIYIDDCYIGAANNISTSTNVTDWAAYTPTLGAGFGSATNISFFYARSGDTLLVKGTFTTGTTAASLGSFTLPSGLSINTSKISISNTTSNPGPQVGTFSAPNANYYGPLVTAVGTSSSLVYVGDQIANSAKLTPQNVSVVIGSTVVVSVNFSVPIQGWSAEPAFRPDLAAVSWSGTSTLTGTTTSASYADPGSVSGAITTVNSRNLTCTAASSLVGISCTFPRTGTVEVCFDGDKSGSTTNTVTTMLADGSGTAIGGDNAVAMFTASAGMPLNDCVQYNVTSLSAQTFKIQMKVNTGTGTVNPKSFSVKMLDQGFPAPILLGSVTSKSTNAEGLERVTFGGATEGTNNCTSSPCTMYRNSAGITSVTRSATGIYVINFASGTFSAAPSCVGNGIVIGTGIGVASQSTATNPTTTTFNMNFKNSSSSDADGGNITVTCMGPK